jgi:hypothetical protein
VGVLCATIAGSNANANPVHVSAMQEVHFSQGEPLEVSTARVGYALGCLGPACTSCTLYSTIAAESSVGEGADAELPVCRIWAVLPATGASRGTSG